MTKFLILFAIVALASVNAQFFIPNHGAFAGAGAGAGAFTGFPRFPFPGPFGAPYPAHGINNLKPAEGVVSSSSVVSSLTSPDGKTNTVITTNNNGEAKTYHIQN